MTETTTPPPDTLIPSQADRLTAAIEAVSQAMLNSYEHTEEQEGDFVAMGTIVRVPYDALRQVVAAAEASLSPTPPAEVRELVERLRARSFDHRHRIDNTGTWTVPVSNAELDELLAALSPAPASVPLTESVREALGQARPYVVDARANSLTNSAVAIKAGHVIRQIDEALALLHPNASTEEGTAP